MDYKLADLIDLDLFQALQDKLNEIYSFPSAIIDNEGTVLTATAWQDLCTKFHRVHPECERDCKKSDLYILEHLDEAKPAVTYRCPRGLVDNATPIVIGGKHLGNYFTGQFFLEEPDLDFFRAQAKEFGFDEAAYLEAVAKVPIWSPAMLDKYLDFIKGFTEILAGIGHRQLQELEARRQMQLQRETVADISVFSQQIVESLGEGLVVYGPDQRYKVWNPFMERLSGVKSAELLGRHPTEVFPFLAGQGMTERIAGALRGEPQPTLEFPFELPSGRIGWTADTIAPLYDRDRQIVGAIATVQDVTARKRAELLVMARVELYEFAKTHTEAELLEAALDKAKQLTGSPTGFFRRVEPGQGMPAASPHEFVVAVRRGGEVKAVLGIGGKACGYDETDQLAVTQLGEVAWEVIEHQRAGAAKLASEALLVNLARMVPGVIYQYRLYPDGSSAFPWASDGMNDIYEVTPEEVREDATPVFGRLHPEDAERVGELIFESARTLERFEVEFRVVLPRQGLRWRWSQAMPERTADGGTLWHGIISDITDRKRVEEERTKLEEQLRHAQKMESVGRLAGGVAHDFNNMLGVIIGHTELARDELAADHPLREDLGEIYKAAQRSAALTKQLLAFARQQTIHPQVLDLNDVVARMLKLLQRLIGEDISLVWRPSADTWLVKMDPSQVDQILANLCVNARDAMVGVGKLTIETNNCSFDEAYCVEHPQFTPGEYVRLAVSDTGSGIDQAHLPHLFEPFFTTKPKGTGTGLGLATVYGIVRQNEGLIEVASEQGVGTTFAIYLHREHDVQPAATAVQPGEADLQGDETILLVEDEPTLLLLTRRIVERYGYRVLAASAPHEALRLASEHAAEIDVLLVDVVMPEMNGRELAERVSALCPDLACLFMSGYTADVIGHHGVLDDDVEFIAKPFVPRELAAKLRAVLEGRRAETHGTPSS